MATSNMIAARIVDIETCHCSNLGAGSWRKRQDRSVFRVIFNRYISAPNSRSASGLPEIPRLCLAPARADG
jgi:hypothetical protein